MVLQANEGSLWAKQVKQPHNTSKSYEAATKEFIYIGITKKQPKCQRKAKQQGYEHEEKQEN